MSDNELCLQEIGKRIMDRRKKLGLTQEALAEKGDVTTQFVSYAESGKRAMRPENLLKISSALEVSADYLLTGEIIDKDLLILSDKLRRLTPSQVRRESAVSTITETVRTAMETVRRENAASAETMETARTAAETVREETAITAEEVETVREAEDHSVSVPHVQTEADREIMAEDRSQERMMIPRIRTAVREETAAEPSIRALQAIQ